MLSKAADLTRRSGVNGRHDEWFVEVEVSYKASAVDRGWVRSKQIH